MPINRNGVALYFKLARVIEGKWDNRTGKHRNGADRQDVPGSSFKSENKEGGGTIIFWDKQKLANLFSKSVSRSILF